MELTEGRYTIGGIDVLELCEKYETPLYVYDSNVFKRQYNKLKNSFDVPKLKIHYACKALTNINVLKLFRSWGSSLDTVSFQEILLGMKAGFDPHDIMFTPNGVSIDELEEAVKMGVKINIDNIETLEYFGHHHKNTPICIRINPHVMAGGNRKISVGHIDSKFGISFHQLPLIERITKTLGIKVNGIHMHTGSDILDADIFLYAADILFKVAKKFPSISYIDFGSGFKVKYKNDDIETDIADFGKKMSARFHRFCEEMGKDIELCFEPGKFLVSEAGYFLAKTNVVKQTTSTVFAGLDTGFNHFIRPMFYGSHHHISNLSNPSGKPKIYTVVGYICETDTFGVNRVINEIRPEDVLCFNNAGAYCFEMSSNYNSRFKPAEVLIHKGKDYLIRKRESMDDLTRNLVELPFKKPVLNT